MAIKNWDQSVLVARLLVAEDPKLRDLHAGKKILITLVDRQADLSRGHTQISYGRFSYVSAQPICVAGSFSLVYDSLMT